MIAGSPSVITDPSTLLSYSAAVPFVASSQVDHKPNHNPLGRQSLPHNHKKHAPFLKEEDVRQVSMIGEYFVQVGGDIDCEAKYDYSGYDVAMSGDGKRIVVGAIYNDGNGTDSGHFRVYEESSTGSWVQVGDDVNGESAGDYFGWSVDMSSDGKRVVAGAIYNDGANGKDSGHVRIFEESDGTWIQMGDDIDGEAPNDWLGWNVAISGNGRRVVVGAFFNDGENGFSSGHARIYEESDGTWTQVGEDIDGEAANDKAGSVSISYDGKRVVVGADSNRGANGLYSGHARVFEDDNGSWLQIGEDIDGEAGGDYSGRSVDMSGDGKRIIVGADAAYGNGFLSGHARIFEEKDGKWAQVGKNIDGKAADDAFGTGVAISSDGKRVIIGGPDNDNAYGMDSGHARIFEERNGSWLQVGEDIYGEESRDELGHSVAISSDGRIIIVGAPWNDSCGNARVFMSQLRTSTSPSVSPSTSAPTISSTAASKLDIFPIVLFLSMSCAWVLHI